MKNNKHGTKPCPTRYVKFIDNYYLEDDEFSDIQFTCETQSGQHIIAYLPRGMQEPELYSVGIIELRNGWNICSLDSWGNGTNPRNTYFGGNIYREFRVV